LSRAAGLQCRRGLSSAQPSCVVEEKVGQTNGTQSVSGSLIYVC